MPRLEELDDEGAPPQVYLDDESTTVHSDDADAVLVGSEASDEERYAQRPYYMHKYVRKYIPSQARSAWKAAKTWVKGPQPPRPWKIRPLFPAIQLAPLQFLNNYFPKRKHKIALLVFFYFCWFLSFALVLHRSAFAADIPGYGSPVRIRCTDRLWHDENDCGLNGDLCRPFANSSMTFRCPANCKRVQLLNPHAVGDQVLNYRPLVVGGPTDEDESLENTYYRADSFICGAAIHAGFINDASGGCGVLSFNGEKSNYPSVNRNHITSIAFDSYFPRSFSFLGGTASKCRDLRWPLLGVSLTFTILLSLFTSSPPVFFSSIFLGIFFHVALASDPPNLTDYYAIVSIALGRFLPASFCMFAVYRFFVRRTLQGLHAQIEKTILWLGGCWIGALNNYTFDKIPIERLTPSDIKQQPGAIPALIIIVLTLFVIAIGQAWCLRVEGRLPKYITIYGIYIAVLLALVAIPKMNVRIHHYILGLLLVAGTSMQTRPSLLFQGILVGLFINGIARWGFDSILQTPAELRGDAPLGTLLPIVTAPIIHNNVHYAALKPNITFEWDLPFPKFYDGISVLVNDVERFRGYQDAGLEPFTWEKHAEGMNEYFRFAYLSGSARNDYTKAGTWRGEDGGWTDMEAGPS
ncbi:hypothetical protein P280DRAFT_416312 [Massarina eburnea CBS 473.64]|uniref:LCCL domain-containing protein n=1 Tax=Massarina eburnea CBS 473.64 TaxID=1395130 RepID=A0A6A6SIH9_9PLEO|nr:hypothetical protein P280DRAFT_416312 [Massarina eburnea CBS 473.64]